MIFVENSNVIHKSLIINNFLLDRIFTLLDSCSMRIPITKCPRGRALNFADGREFLMSASPMTEKQGDKVIQLLEDILWELKNGSISGPAKKTQPLPLPD